MEATTIPEILWPQISEFIAAKMGLDFPASRRSDLARGLTRTAEELGFADDAECAEWLLSGAPTKAQLWVLASHLTVGETYFFREKKMFETLAGSVLPELIRAKRNRERRLRIWSAACCTGEEAYSLAILLSQVLPSSEDWHVSILATDINERFLRKAVSGVYGEWSFRETTPDFKERYFQRTDKGQYAILPEIKRRVTFAHLNLVEDVYPALATDTNAMDLIFCRNVLMYFTPPQMRKAVANLRRSLVDGGWLVVSPSEVSQGVFFNFKAENFPGLILYRKTDVKTRPDEAWRPPLPDPLEFIAPPVEAPAPWFPVGMPPAAPSEEPAAVVIPPSPGEMAARFYEEGRYEETSDLLLSTHAPPNTAGEFSLLARALANQGRLNDALAWCDRWLATDKLDSSAHYLRAVVLQELGDHETARQALQRAIYLQPELVLAHFALGNAARAGGRAGEAERHFSNARHLLAGHPPEEILAESEGLTAGRLTEIITSLLAIETTP